jgi:hypothetical protein
MTVALICYLVDQKTWMIMYIYIYISVGGHASIYRALAPTDFQIFLHELVSISLI